MARINETQVRKLIFVPYDVCVCVPFAVASTATHGAFSSCVTLSPLAAFFVRRVSVCLCVCVYSLDGACRLNIERCNAYSMFINFAVDDIIIIRHGIGYAPIPDAGWAFLVRHQCTRRCIHEFIRFVDFYRKVRRYASTWIANETISIDAGNFYYFTLYNSFEKFILYGILGARHGKDVS